MPTLTAGTFLMKGTGSGSTISYTKLADITEYPDIGDNVDTQDVTTLTDACHKYIESLPDSGGTLEFSGWLNATDLTAVKALEDADQQFAVWFGGTKSGTVITPTGSILKVSFTGRVHIVITGAGTDEARPVQYLITVMSGYTYEIGSDS